MTPCPTFWAGFVTGAAAGIIAGAVLFGLFLIWLSDVMNPKPKKEP